MTDSNSILSMTEHGAYVWPVYIIAAVLLVGLVVTSLNALKQTRTELQRTEDNMSREDNEA